MKKRSYKRMEHDYEENDNHKKRPTPRVRRLNLKRLWLDHLNDYESLDEFFCPR